MATSTRQPAAEDPTGALPFLLRLYPPAWRTRYGAEFADLLVARPPSARDRLDIVRGAMDARLRPQLPDARPPRVAATRDRVLALAAITVGALFSAWAGTIVIASPGWGEMDTEGNTLIAASYVAGMLGSFIAAAVLIGIALRHGDDLGPIGIIGAVVAALGFLLMTTAGAPSIALIVAGTVALCPGLARAIGTLVSALVAGSTLFLASAMLGLIVSSGQDLLWLWMLVGYGPAWILLGLGLMRGARVHPPAVAGA